MKKRIISALLVLVLCTGLLPTMSLATEATGSNEAKIGNTEYGTFAEALAVANATDATTGAEITILKDETPDVSGVITGNVTIIQNYKKIGIDPNPVTTGLTVKNGGKLTVKGSLSYSFIVPIMIENGATVVLEGIRNTKQITFEGDGEDTSLTMKNCQYYDSLVVPQKATVQIFEGTLSSVTVQGDKTLRDIVAPGYIVRKDNTWIDMDQKSCEYISIVIKPLKDLNVTVENGEIPLTPESSGKYVFEMGEANKSLRFKASVTTQPTYFRVYYSWKLDGQEVGSDSNFGPLTVGTEAGQLTLGSHTIECTAKDSDDFSLSKSVTIDIVPTPLTVEIDDTSPITKKYDGNNNASVNLVFKHASSGAIQQLLEDDYTVVATFDDADIGADKPIKIDISLDSKYVFSENGLTSITLGEDDQYKGSITKTDAPTDLRDGSLMVYNKYAKSYSFDFSALLPELDDNRSYGTISYGIKSNSLNQSYFPEDSVSINANTGIATLNASNVNNSTTGSIGELVVAVTPTNYESFDLKLNVSAGNRTDLIGGAPTLSKTTITYGDALSTIALSGSMIGNNNEQVTGTFAWTQPSTILKAGSSQSAIWTFTPSTQYERYMPASGAAIIDVQRKEVTITGLTVQNRAYNGGTTVQFSSGSAVVDGKISGDDVYVDITNASATIETSKAENGKTVTVSNVTLGGDDAGNYLLVSQPDVGTVNITKAGQHSIDDIITNQKFTITTQQTVQLGNIMPADAGILNYTTGSSSVSGTAIVSSFTVDENGLAKYTITGGDAGAVITLPIIIKSENYNDSTVNVKITLMARDAQNDLTLSTNTTSVEYNGSLTLATSGGSGIGDVTYAVSPPDAASIDGNTLTAKKVGTFTIIATKAADINYNAKDSNTITITVTKATPTGKPQYTSIAEPKKTLADAALVENVTNTTTGGFSVPGTVIWVDDAGNPLADTIEVQANTNYKWLFTPTDTTNYNTLTGSIILYPVYSGGGSSSNTVTIPVSSENSSINVKAEVNKTGTATIQISNKEIQEVISNGSGTVNIDVSKLEDVKSVKIPADVVDTISKASEASLNVELSDGSVALDSTALESVATGNDVTIFVKEVPATELTEEQQKTVEDMANIGLVFDIDVFVGNTKQTTFNGGKLTISVSYTPKKGEDTSKLTVWFIREDGTIENKGGYYDAQKGCFVFETDHLSRYLLVSVKEQFSDVSSDDYYAAAVNWAVSQNITNGMGNGKFGPDLSCTRGQIVTFLYRCAIAQGVDVNCGEDTNILSYTDAFTVPEFAMEPFQWACGSGIIQGSSGKLMPNDNCTRSEIVTMLYRYAISTGKDVSVGEDTNILSFNDAFNLSEYAIPAFQWAVGTGIIQGSNNNLMPAQNCTRGQIVTMLYRMLEQQ